MASANIIAVDEQSFQQQVLQSDKPVLVFFWSTRSKPCNAMTPILDQLADEYAGRVRFATINLDESQSFSHEFQISTTPTYLVFTQGQVGDRTSGTMTKSVFQTFLNRCT